MQRTYRKDMIVIKNFDGGMIEEAHVFLRDGAQYDDDDVVKEACDIISRSNKIRSLEKKRQRFSLPEFIIGAVCSALISLSIVLIFM